MGLGLEHWVLPRRISSQPGEHDLVRVRAGVRVRVRARVRVKGCTEGTLTLALTLALALALARRARPVGGGGALCGALGVVVHDQLEVALGDTGRHREIQGDAGEIQGDIVVHDQLEVALVGVGLGVGVGARVGVGVRVGVRARVDLLEARHREVQRAPAWSGLG